MNIIFPIVCILCLNGYFCIQNSNEGNGIQIVLPVNHTLQLELSELKLILESDEIRDRHLVIVSVAGPLRKGKSFLLNFFIKYLRAQVTIF